MKKLAKLLSLVLSTSLASQMISSVNINATKDSITFYDVKNNILDLKAYDAELDTNHDGNMNVFDVIRANKTLIQEESYTDLKEKVYMLETQIESLYQKLNEKTDAEEGKQLSSNDYTNEEKRKLESLNNYDDTIINEKIDSLVQIAYDEKEKIESSIENKVNKEEGRQLSSNDYTDEEKQKLESLNNYDDAEIKSEIKNINNALNRLSIPYENEREILINKCEQIKSKDIVLFSLFTDVHASDILNDYEPSDSSKKYDNNGYKNYRQMAELVRMISEDAGVDFIVNLGDTINSTIDESDGDFNKTETKKRFAEFTRNIQKTYLPYIYTTAHHELHPYNQNISDGTIDSGMMRSELYGIANKSSKNINLISNDNDENKNYYYFDMPVQGVRFIVLDSACKTNMGYSDSEVGWLSNVALNTPYKVVVFSHMATKENNSKNSVVNGEEIETILNDNGNVLAFFHGHTHWDNIIEPNESNVNYPYVSTVNSWCIKTPLPDDISKYLGTPTIYDREYDTYNEYAVDFVALNCETGDINMYRFGVGYDREYKNK